MGDDMIPKPLFCNHDKALDWANRRLSQYAEIRSVALILKSDMTNQNQKVKMEFGVSTLNQVVFTLILTISLNLRRQSKH